MPDLDQGGTFRTRVRQSLGPSVGWTELLPGQWIMQVTAPGTYSVPVGTTVVAVNVAGAVTLFLPSAILPASGAIAQPGLFGNIPILIVDVGGNAQAHPITIMPNSVAETIMGLTSISINTNYGSFLFNPNAPNLVTARPGASVLTQALGRSQRSVTSSPATATINDQILNVNISGGSPTLSLPQFSLRSGLQLTIKDVGGNFAAFPLTITPFGTDPIDGVVGNLTLSVNHGEVTLVPFNDGVNNGWFIS